MSDLIERLRRAAKHEDGWAIMADAADEIDRLLLELHESDDLRERLAAILTATANALKGQPKTLHAHSWHDLAEAASQVVAERDALRARIDGAPVVRPYVTGVTDDCTIDEAIDRSFAGKRVVLVVIE